MLPPPPRSTRPATLLPFTSLFRSRCVDRAVSLRRGLGGLPPRPVARRLFLPPLRTPALRRRAGRHAHGCAAAARGRASLREDRTPSEAPRRERAGDHGDRRGGGLPRHRGFRRRHLYPAARSRRRRNRLVFRRRGPAGGASGPRSEEHTSELQSLMRISYAVFCLKKKITI